MRQINIEIDKTSPKTSRFVVPASEHFSVLVRYKNWEDKQEWLDYTLVDDAGTDVVKYKKEAENDSVLYFCGIMDTSTNLRFKTSTLASTLAPRDTMQVVALASSSQDNCYICSADYARTTGEGGSGGFNEDTTTLSVAFGGLAKKITPKDVISFSSLTWQGQKHELGSKDHGVFDGNFQLDEAFWPAKPLPGYLYVQVGGFNSNDSSDITDCRLRDTNGSVGRNRKIIDNFQFLLKDTDKFITLYNYNEMYGGNRLYKYALIKYNCTKFTIDKFGIFDTAEEFGYQKIDEDLQSYAYILIQTPIPNAQKYLFIQNEDGSFPLDLTIDGISYMSFNKGTVFVNVKSNFSTSSGGVTMQYVMNNSFETVSMEPGQEYFLENLGNSNFVTITTKSLR